MDEGVGQAVGAEPPSHALCPQHAEAVEGEDEQHRGQQSDEEGELESVLGRKPDVLEELGDVGCDRGPRRRLGRPVEGDRTDDHRQEGDGPGGGRQGGETRQRLAQSQLAVPSPTGASRE